MAWLPALLVALASLYGPAAHACSSCGSGGDDPLILYPNEPFKVYAAASDESRLRNINQKGEETPSYGLIRRRRLVIAAGALITPESFVTLTVPYVVNYSQTRHREGLGDPTLAARYTFWPQSIARPLVPQLQVIGAVKPKVGRGIDEPKDPEFLDVFGSGFTEYRGGFDIWSGMTPVQYGMSQQWVMAIPKHTDGGKQKPGNKEVATVTIGAPYSRGKVVSGISRIRAGKRVTNGIVIDGSEIIQHNIFLTADFKATDEHTIRLTTVRQAAFGRNVNTSRSTVLTLAYMGAFL